MIMTYNIELSDKEITFISELLEKQSSQDDWLDDDWSYIALRETFDNVPLPHREVIR